MKWLKRIGAALLLCVIAVGALAFTFSLKASRPVGFQAVRIPDGDGGSFAAGVWYPSTARPRPTTLIGAQLMDVAPDGPIAGARLPLIVISHGNGGGPGSHADLAMALAGAGYVVAAPMHAGDNFLDESGLAKTSWPADRTRELSLATDYLLSRWSGHGQVDPGRIGAYGFSAGGLTVLAAAGARPDLSTIADHCAHQPEFVCDVLRQAQSPLLKSGPPAATPQPDPRIRAAVIAAPGLGFTMAGPALAQVSIPVQLWSADADVTVPYASNTRIVREGLGQHAEFHAVPGAGHLAFLAPCGPIGPPTICKDAGGFDRKAFHARMNATVIGFFQRTLAPVQQ